MTTLEAGMKRCVDCDEPLVLEAFYKCAASKDGRQSRCIICDRKRRAARRVAASAAAPVEEEIAAAPDTEAGKPYRGISGGLLLYGYVR